jgi:hypothetical protein
MDLVPSDKGRIQPVIWQEYEKIVNAAEGKHVSSKVYFKDNDLHCFS